MTASVAKKAEEREIMPGEVREMFGVDNSGIRELCKRAEIKMKRNNKGLTYFTKEDVKKIKDISSKFDKNSLMTLPQKSHNAVMKKNQSEAFFVKLSDSLKSMEAKLTERVSAMLDEKLDGMDDVVMELIRVKTENETMRFKINELNKENYRLKREVNSYKKVPFGLYTKTNPEKNMF